MRAVLLVLALALAGCLSSPAPAYVSQEIEPESAIPAQSPLAPVAALTNCVQVAGIAWYPMAYFAEFGPQAPFELADIRADIGNARVYGATNGVPPLDSGPASGNWHVALRCNGQDLGFVGVRILPPPWDDGAITRQFFATSLSLPPGPLREAVEAHVPVTDLLEMQVTLAAPVAHAMHRDPDHGRYQTDGIVAPTGARGNETVRLWMLIPEHGTHHHETEGRFRPVALDFMDTGAKDSYLSPETLAVFSHTETDMHGTLPGGAGNVLAAAWQGFGRAVVLGPAPNEWVNGTYIH